MDSKEYRFYLTVQYRRKAETSPSEKSAWSTLDFGNILELTVVCITLEHCFRDSVFK